MVELLLSNTLYMIFLSYFILVSEKWPHKIKKAHVHHIQKNVRGIGTTLRDNIIEILETGQLQRYEEMRNDDQIRSCMKLIEIW